MDGRVNGRVDGRMDQGVDHGVDHGVNCGVRDGVGGGRVRGRVVGLVVGLALIPHVGDIAGVSIIDMVGDDLGAAIRKSNTVLARGSVVVTVLVGSKVGARVVIGNGILVVVHWGSIIGRLVVGRRVGRLVGRSGVRVGGGLVGRSGVRERSGLEGGGWMRVGGRLVGWSRVVGSRVHRMNRGRVVGGRVDGSGVVRSRVRVGSRVSTVVGGSVDGVVSRGVVGGTVLLLIVGLVHLVRGGGGLAHHLGGVAAVGLVDGGVDGGGIALLDALVRVLVGRGQGHQGHESEESLKGQSSTDKDERKRSPLDLRHPLRQSVLP